MTDIDRRNALRLLAAAPVAIGFTLSIDTLWAARAHAAEALAAGIGSYEPKFFSAHEWQTLRLLVDYILPADERSGSASDAGVPEFIDFVVTDPDEEDRCLESRQTAMRGGLAWIDAECLRRFGGTFVTCDDTARRALLDDIAYPEPDQPRWQAEPRDLRVRTPAHGEAFFSSLRDLTASGFWSSRMGVEDLRYMGNTATEWQGPPAAVLKKLGLEPG
jgi:gluconate 2-dehydrogenase gamma chain